jgi:aldo/keto reductase family protein
MTTQATPMPPTPSRHEPPSRATELGTKRFAQRFGGAFVPNFFRADSLGITTSSIGLGTYLGDSTAADDASYQEAARHAIRGGMNVIDTAINYRGQRSERAIGAALKAVLGDTVGRD